MSEYNATKEKIISCPLPEMTSTYKPISNTQLIDLTLESINKAGFSLDREYYRSAKEGNVSTGTYTIKDVTDTEMQLQIMWRNSYDKSLKLLFSVGCRIKVCNNGLMKSHSGGYFQRKHTGDIQEFTPQHIIEYIKKAGDMFKVMQQEREQMKQIELSRTVQAEIIGRMFIEEEFVKSTQLNIIKRELANPTHDYGDPNSLWSLYQYTSFAMKEIHPSLYVQDHLDAHRFFVNQAGIIVPETISHEHTIPVESPFKQLDWVEELSKESND